MGPIPGIIIGIGCGIIYMRTHNHLFSYACDVFILINAFNLLPFSPLDGGRFLEAVLFTRHPKAEVAFKVLAIAGLTWTAFKWKSIALGIVAYFTLVSFKTIWTIAKTASVLRKGLPAEHIYTIDEIPDASLEQIIMHLHDKLPMAQRNAKHLAATAKIWTADPALALSAQGEHKTARIIFRQSIFANLLNPKVAIFFLAFFPQFVRPAQGHPAMQMMILGLTFVVLTMFGFGLVALGAGALNSRLAARPALSIWLHKGAGAILMLLGLRLIWTDR